MAITIPAGAFANSAAQPAATKARAGLDALQQGAEAMASVRQTVDSLSLAMSADADAATAAGALAKARSALAKAGPVAGDDPFTKTLQEAELLRARGRGKLAVQAGIASLVGAIKQLHGLPLPSATRAELGRALIGRAVRHGLIGHDQQAGWDEATTSSLAFEPTRKAIAATSTPGEALAVVEAAKAEGALNQLDSETLDALAAQRQPVEVHRHHARLAWKERDDLAAYARGELPEPLSEESFRLIHGARGAVGAHARYQAARRESEALAQIRGKDPAAIAEAEAAWQGDAAVFAAARAKDAAERQRDPVAYVIATQPGLTQALKEATPAEASWLLWQAQAAVGIPENERSPWSRAQQEALADAWNAISADQSGRNGRLVFFRTHVQSLPSAQRAAAIRTLVRQGITDGTEAELTRLVAELDNGRVNPARTLGAELTPAGTQFAKHSEIGDSSVAEPGAVTPGAEGTIAPQEPIDWRSRGLPDAQTSAAWTASIYEPVRQGAIAGTLERILALETDPANLPTVEDEIRQRFAGDDVAIDFFTLQARTLARAEGDDPITGDDRRTWARDLVGEARGGPTGADPDGIGSRHRLGN